MHELPATRGMLEVALEAADGAGADHITSIDVVVGELTTIVDDSVQFYFDIISEGTPAADAELRFRREPATGLCGECGQEHPVSPPLGPCPECGSLAVSVTGGDEFYVESIEVEDGDPRRTEGDEGQRPGGGRQP
jgi:hydrogenase nickel incorporation protein HypA/HybF